MISRWLVRYLWRPFENQCRRTPLWPLRATITEPVHGVKCLRIDNGMTRALSKLAGGYDYAVSYLINGVVLIDTGFPWAGKELKRILIQNGWDRTIKIVINTHYHEDHVGNNDVLGEISSARFCGSAGTVSAARMPPPLKWYRRFLFGPIPSAKIEVCSELMEVDGLEIRLIDTPGHCPGHICAFVPSTGWLFSGDLFVAPDLDTQLPDVDGPAWILSLERILALPVTALFDAHATIIIGAKEVQKALTEKLEFLKGIERRVQQYFDAASSVEDLTRRVFIPGSFPERLALGDGWMSVLTGSDFSRHHLVESFARPLASRGTTLDQSGP